MMKLDYHEILQQTEAECAMAQRELGSAPHIQRVKEFLFFIRHLVGPDGVSDYDFASYQPVVEAACEKSQIKLWSTLRVLMMWSPDDRHHDRARSSARRLYRIRYGPWAGHPSGLTSKIHAMVDTNGLPIRPDLQLASA